MTNIITNKIPETVTVSCPLKQFQQRYIVKGCGSCEFFKDFAILTTALETEVKDSKTGIVTGTRALAWHERFMIVCAYPMTRRCANVEVIDE